MDTICSDIKRAWVRILQDIGANEGQISMFANKHGKEVPEEHWQLHSAQIRKSVGSYFSKYAGKEESKQSWYCQKYPISRFWGSSATIKEVINQNSMEYEWDFQGNLEEAEKFHEELIARILLESNVVSMSGYSFHIRGKRSYKAVIGEDGNLRIYDVEPKTIAQGERLCAYVAPTEFSKILKQSKEMAGFF